MNQQNVISVALVVFFGAMVCWSLYNMAVSPPRLVVMSLLGTLLLIVLRYELKNIVKEAVREESQKALERISEILENLEQRIEIIEATEK